MTKQVDKTFDASILIYVQGEILDSLKNRLWYVINSEEIGYPRDGIRSEMAHELLRFIDETEKRIINSI